MIVNVTKLPVNDFVWVEETFQFNGDFKKLYNENSNIRHFIEADILYTEKFYELHNDFSILSKSMKIEKLVANLHDNTLFTWEI